MCHGDCGYRRCYGRSRSIGDFRISKPDHEQKNDQEEEEEDEELRDFHAIPAWRKCRANGVHGAPFSASTTRDGISEVTAEKKPIYFIRPMVRNHRNIVENLYGSFDSGHGRFHFRATVPLFVSIAQRHRTANNVRRHVRRNRSLRWWYGCIFLISTRPPTVTRDFRWFLLRKVDWKKKKLKKHHLLFRINPATYSFFDAGFVLYPFFFVFWPSNVTIFFVDWKSISINFRAIARQP